MGVNDSEWYLLNISSLSEHDKERIRTCKKKHLLNRNIKLYKRKILEYHSRLTDIDTSLSKETNRPSTEQIENMEAECSIIHERIRDYTNRIQRLQKEYCSL